MFKLILHSMLIHKLCLYDNRKQTNTVGIKEIQAVDFSQRSVSHLWISSVHLWPYSQPGHLVPPPTLTFAPPLRVVFIKDYDVDMNEEEEGEVFMRKATAGHWWEDCGDDGNCDTQQHQRGGGGGGCMVNSRSWAEELKDIFAPREEDCYSGGRTRLSSISVSDLVFLSETHKHWITHSESICSDKFHGIPQGFSKSPGFYK